MKLSEVLKMIDGDDHIKVIDVDVSTDALPVYKEPAGDCTDDEELLSMNATDIAAIKDILLIFGERG